MRTVSTHPLRLLVASCALFIACREPAPEAATRTDAAPGAETPAAAPATEGPAQAAEPLESERPRGLWVLAEGSQRVLENPERIDELLATAPRLGVSDLFVQVYRGGRAWYASSHADDGPHRALVANAGRDTLSELIDRAHAQGLRVHAWVNVLSLAGNRDAPLVRRLGPEAIQTDRRGRSILDYPKLEVPQPDRRYYRMGTPAVWLDPGAPGVREALVATFGELVRNYPSLDGLHLDYIRYPDVLPFSPGSRFGVGLDFGYGEATRQRFETETGLRAPLADSLANANRWDDWRRDQVTGLVRDLRDELSVAGPGMALSAAVWTYADRSYLSLGQDWRGWLDDGLLDFAVPMSYTLDDRLLRHQVESFAGAPFGDRVWIGLGTWLFAKEPARAVAQAEIARRAGAAGDAFFSYDAIADSQALHSALAEARNASAPVSSDGP